MPSHPSCRSSMPMHVVSDVINYVRHDCTHVGVIVSGDTTEVVVELDVDVIKANRVNYAAQVCIRERTLGGGRHKVSIAFWLVTRSGKLEVVFRTAWMHHLTRL